MLGENDRALTFVGIRFRLLVFDYDDGLNRQMEVYIVEGNGGNEFRLDVDEGGPLLTIVQELDREKFSQESVSKSQFASPGPSTAVRTIQIAAKDKGTPARVGRTTVVNYINDINDNAPKFMHESYHEFIEENAPIFFQASRLGLGSREFVLDHPSTRLSPPRWISVLSYQCMQLDVCRARCS